MKVPRLLALVSRFPRTLHVTFLASVSLLCHFYLLCCLFTQTCLKLLPLDVLKSWSFFNFIAGRNLFFFLPVASDVHILVWMLGPIGSKRGKSKVIDFKTYFDKIIQSSLASSIEAHTLIFFFPHNCNISSLEIVENNYLLSHLQLFRGKLYHCWVTYCCDETFHTSAIEEHISAVRS